MQLFYAFTFTVWRTVSRYANADPVGNCLPQRQRRPLSTMKDANADTEGFSDDVKGHCTASGCVAPEQVHRYGTSGLE